MKKIIYLLIYILGCAISFGWGYDLKDRHAKEDDRCLTYGDITILSVISITSWISVMACAIVEISESDFFNKQINCK